MDEENSKFICLKGKDSLNKLIQRVKTKDSKNYLINFETYTTLEGEVHKHALTHPVGEVAYLATPLRRACASCN
jgi:hypothetical protein